MLKYSREVSMIVLVDIECTDYSWIFNRRVSTVETSRFYSMPKLENFLNHQAKIIIEIAWHF